MTVLLLAADLLREARSRRWTLALAGATTLVLLLVAAGLELEVVDGALAATRFFGGRSRQEIQPVEVALRPLFAGAAALLFWAGLAFGVLGSADFAPALLAPGRIEHLLSLPVRRWELLVGTYLGVLALVLGGALYGGVGLSLVVMAKTGVFGWAPAAAALLAAAGFAAVYAVMLLAAVAVRSAALSGAAGGGALLLFLVAGYRAELAPMFSRGLGRSAFLLLTAPLPRLAGLAQQAGLLAEGRALEWPRLLAQLGGAALFAGAALAAAVALFERKDF